MLDSEIDKTQVNFKWQIELQEKKNIPEFFICKRY